ncbi:MAG: nucleotide exchange factor GrpE [Lachnospiraceae bacterium]|nr:nucleotide exchange factor GrpE [Lachnospiraceae bacterium]
MADVKETLVKEAIRRAEEEAARKNKEVRGIFGGDGNAGNEDDDTAEERSESDEVTEDGVINNTENPEDADTDLTNEQKSGENGETDDDTETENDIEPDDDANDPEASDGDNPEADAKVKKKPSIFGKKNKKDPREEKIEELNDRLLRNLAEFENFRKRTEKEKSQMFEIGAKSIIEKILPAIDSFERGLASVSEEEKDSPLASGMEKIYKQLMGSLEEAGLKPIEAVGKEFDPNLHNAVMHEDNDELGENVVSEELQKGYMYRDNIVRHSMVKVAN